jgi:pimeloyl-ACP methyl ester carboxylesterase
MARAAQRLDGTGLSGGTPVGVMGYSQGGTSAGWAAELASTYTPELDLKGVVASGVPADLAEVASFLEGRLAFAFALFAAVGYDAAYPELDLPSYLDADGRELLEDMQDVCLVSIDGIAGILGTAFKDIDDYTTENPLEDAAWQARLGENRLGSVAPTVPVFQAHARLDEIVPLGQAEQLREDWCARGANLTWRTYGGEHAIGLVISQADSLSFLADRFAGRSTGGNC